jgi:hypothetical protein
LGLVFGAHGVPRVDAAGRRTGTHRFRAERTACNRSRPQQTFEGQQAPGEEPLPTRPQAPSPSTPSQLPPAPGPEASPTPGTLRDIAVATGRPSQTPLAGNQRVPLPSRKPLASAPPSLGHTTRQVPAAGVHVNVHNTATSPVAPPARSRLSAREVALLCQPPSHATGVPVTLARCAGRTGCLHPGSTLGT